MKRKKHPLSLEQRYPPSAPCCCTICRAYCARPGWWTVEQAERALKAGYGWRMMLELSPDLSFGVLSPAFRGCEGTFAFQEFSQYGCTFYRSDLCTLYGTGYEPLECRFCHHARQGQGTRCHKALEKDWHTSRGQSLVKQWLLLIAPGAMRVVPDQKTALSAYTSGEVKSSVQR